MGFSLKWDSSSSSSTFLKSPRNGIWEQNLCNFDLSNFEFQNNYFQSRITRWVCQIAQDQHGSRFLACL